VESNDVASIICQAPPAAAAATATAAEGAEEDSLPAAAQVESKSIFFRN